MRFFPASKFISHIQKRYCQSVKWTGFPIKYEFQKEEKTRISILPSGLRVVTHHVSGPTATVGLFIDSGSRAENEKNNGVAHFFEHMAFKGTSKMNQSEMENLVENLGTRLFAYTSREQTVYYGKCFSTDAPKVLEILSDIIQRPLLSEKGIERERSVILREMEDINTQLDEVVFDHLHGTAYQGSPLCYTILGPIENIKNISKKDLNNYIKKHYTAGRIVLIAVGDVDHEEYVKLATKYLSEVPATSDADLASWYKPAKYLGSSALFRNDDMPFAHIAYAYEGVPPTHPDFIPLMLASTFIGSWDQSCTNGKVMPSFLAQESSIHDKIRTFTSFNAPYKDTALWGIYYTGNGYQLEDFAQIVSLQMKKLQSNMTEGSIAQAKNALKTNYLLQIDGTTPLFEEIGRQILTYGRRITNEEFEQEIDRCTASTVETAVKNMITGKCPVIAAIGPIQTLPDYLQIKNMALSFLF